MSECKRHVEHGCAECRENVRREYKRELIQAIRDEFNEPELHEFGAFIWSEDIIEIIERFDDPVDPDAAAS